MRVSWIALLFCSILVVACQPSPVASPPVPLSWTDLTATLPHHTAVTALASDPSNSKRIFAATYDAVGMYASDDGGVTWHVENTYLPQAPVFSLLATDQELFAGTADGLYRRAWRATFWERADPVPQVAIYGMVRNLAGFFVTTDGRGIWSSVDGGATWSRLPGLDDESILTVLPIDAFTVLAGTAGHGLFLTRDGGMTWNAALTFGQAYVSFIVNNPQQPENIYARTRGGVYLSQDEGTTWTKLDGIQHEVVNALWFDPTRMLAATAGGGILMSDDGGTTWRAAQVENPRKRAVLNLFRVDKTLYAGTAEGLVYSTDNGDTWHALTQGPGTPLIHDVTSAGNQIWLATEDGVYRQDGKGGWARVDFGIEDTPALAITSAPSDHQRMYLGTDGKGVFVSQDGGATWNAAGGDLGGKTHVSEVAVDPTHPDTVFARILFERIYKSKNAGAAWRTVWGGVPVEEQLQSMAIAPGDATQMWAGGDTQLYASTNSGETWQPRGPNGVSSLAIWIDAKDAGQVWVGATDGLYITKDAGETWSAPLMHGTTITAIARDAAGTAYLGTQFNGVFVTHDDGKTFTPFGLANASVTKLVWNDLNKTLFALTPNGLMQTVVTQ